MRKNILLAFLVLLFSENLNAQNIEKSNELEKLVSTFLYNYSVSRPMSTHVTFFRKNDTLHVAKMKNHKEVEIDEPYYVFSSQEYLPISVFNKKIILHRTDSQRDFLPYEKLDTFEQKVADSYLKKYNRLQGILKDAAIFPSYGYKGFYNDVIALYENKTNLDVEQQLALCRAYSFKFTNLLFPNPYGLEEERIQLELNDTLNQQQLAYFLQLFEHQKAAYLVLKTKFPDFQYITGSTAEKYGQEVVHAYLTLSYHTSETTALQVLEDNLFSDSLVAAAKKILDACPPNAVLYNFKDQDTYPLYYVQAHYKYRQDVTLSNMSLMVLPRYAKMIYEGKFDALPLNSTIFSKFYRKRLIVVSPNSHPRKDSTQNIKDYFDFINQYDVIHGRLYNDYMRVDISVVEIPLPEGCSKSSLHINLPKHHTFSELSQLDILYSNHFKRPLCFTKNCLKSQHFLFGDVITEKEHILELDINKICDY